MLPQDGAPHLRAARSPLAPLRERAQAARTFASASWTWSVWSRGTTGSARCVRWPALSARSSRSGAQARRSPAEGEGKPSAHGRERPVWGIPRRPDHLSTSHVARNRRAPLPTPIAEAPSVPEARHADPRPALQQAIRAAGSAHARWACSTASRRRPRWTSCARSAPASTSAARERSCWSGGARAEIARALDAPRKQVDQLATDAGLRTGSTAQQEFLLERARDMCGEDGRLPWGAHRVLALETDLSVSRIAALLRAHGMRGTRGKAKRKGVVIAGMLARLADDTGGLPEGTYERIATATGSAYGTVHQMARRGGYEVKGPLSMRTPAQRGASPRPTGGCSDGDSRPRSARRGLQWLTPAPQPSARLAQHGAPGRASPRAPPSRRLRAPRLARGVRTLRASRAPHRPRRGVLRRALLERRAGPRALRGLWTLPR